LLSPSSSSSSEFCQEREEVILHRLRFLQDSKEEETALSMAIATGKTSFALSTALRLNKSEMALSIITAATSANEVIILYYLFFFFFSFQFLILLACFVFSSMSASKTYSLS
jgi:hypothetical protein